MRVWSDQPIDTVELCWGLERHRRGATIATLALISGRAVETWTAAIALGDAPLPSVETVAARYEILRWAWLVGFTVEAVSDHVRAPRAWCVEAARRLPEFQPEESAPCRAA